MLQKEVYLLYPGLDVSDGLVGTELAAGCF